MDIAMVLACCALVALAFDRFGAMIPDSSWGGMYVVTERMWAGPAVEAESEAPRLEFDRPSSASTDDEATIDASDDPVAIIEEVTASRPHWLG